MLNKHLKIIAQRLALKIDKSKENKTYHVKPFKHIIIDDAFDSELAELVHSSFPNLDEECWEHTDTPGIEVKSRTNWQSEFDIPDEINAAIRVLNSALILKSMSRALDIPKLMPDPYFTGGGLNVTQSGGLLDIHVDGNYHDASGMNRRVNVLLYLNKGWQESWGGQFGIYGDEGKKLVKAVNPIFNRLVIFDTHDKSFHGLPQPITCPNTETRKSIILYYYTVAKRPADQNEYSDPHSALWKSQGYKDKRGRIKREFE